MLRTRDLLIVTIPAALLAFLAQPSLDGIGASADAAAARTVSATGTARAKVLAHVGAAERAASPTSATRSAEETPPVPSVRPRPRVGCEGAISALAGQEARRLLPSRCLV